MFHPFEILDKAKQSSFYLWMLNWGIGRVVPFNKPHGVKVLEVGENHMKTMLPYRRKNFNHIKGLHACGLATITEFTSGLLLLAKLDQGKYRIIMQRLEMDYHYQGKMDAIASYAIAEDWLTNEIYKPLETQDSVVVTCEVKIHDSKGSHLTTGKVYWQVKDWSKVRTKISMNN